LNEIIESMDNPKIKEVRSLHKKKFRTSLGKYFVEGKRIVEEAITHDANIERIIITSTYPWDKEFPKATVDSRMKNIEILTVTEKVFRSIAKTESPQGILAIIHKQENHIEKALEKLPKNPFIVTLESVQDPGNMGTIIRTAEAAGVDLIIITENSTDPYGDKALRSSMGAIFHIPIIEVEGLDWVNQLKELKVRLIATDLSASKSYEELDYHGGVTLIIGNEGNGVSKELLDLCDEKTIIPIYGCIESLNASIASGILIYKAREKRNFTK